MSDEKQELKSLEDHGIFLLSGEIDDENVDDCIRWIIESNLNNHYSHLTLIINSEGGFIHSGFALISIIESSLIPIHTIGIGLVASMGLNIFITGTKGHRTLSPNTIVMSHQWAGGHYGKEHELIAQQKEGEIITKQIIDHYKRHTKLSEKDIRKYLLPPGDMYMTSSESKKLKLCDRIANFNVQQFSKMERKRVTGHKR